MYPILRRSRHVRCGTSTPYVNAFTYDVDAPKHTCMLLAVLVHSNLATLWARVAISGNKGSQITQKLIVQMSHSLDRHRTPFTSNTFVREKKSFHITLIALPHHPFLVRHWLEVVQRHVIIFLQTHLEPVNGQPRNPFAITMLTHAAADTTPCCPDRGFAAHSQHVSQRTKGKCLRDCS